MLIFWLDQSDEMTTLNNDGMSNENNINLAENEIKVLNEPSNDIKRPKSEKQIQMNQMIRTI